MDTNYLFAYPWKYLGTKLVTPTSKKQLVGMTGNEASQNSTESQALSKYIVSPPCKNEDTQGNNHNGSNILLCSSFHSVWVSSTNNNIISHSYS